ncbi:hypothetical protein [Treponema denticola]|uniref:hypothetical protein n=1 Tax=Treponema denticola TaxID=158 RepID=UPI00210693EE|nr:hypothetical protein [Treponema denticola]UTY24335.1 hypothetical protein E4N78_09555 [Treponema denticola]
MKKKILFVLALAAVLSACKMKLSENTGTVVIDFGGNERAVDSNGLPIIKDAAMSLEIISSNGSEKKEFAAGQEKTWSGSFPIGEKLTIKVSLSTASAEWKGYAEHTVTSGTNPVSVKLKKSAAVLHNLLFGTDKLHGQDVHVGGPHAPYTLTLKIGSKEVKKEHIMYYNFCRDNKARIYLAYNTGNQWDIERYKSEGDKDDKSFDGFMGVSPLILASDHATGKVYIAAEISSGSSGNMKLYRINEAGGSPIELTGASLGHLTGYAVYNNVLIASGYGMGGPELKMYRITEDTVSEITLSVQPNLREDTKITLEALAGWLHGTINDLYMTKDALYLLFSAFGNHSSDSYSLGGIVKYSYSADGTTASISTPVRIGIANEHTSDGNGIYPTDESNFYGPVKVIGFDEENLYIADDGIKFEFQKGKPRITANKNRIAKLNKGTNVFTFNDAPSGITWLGEDPVWAGVSTKTLVWKKNSVIYSLAVGGVSYYQLTQPDGTPSPDNLLKLNSSGASPDQMLYFTDVFCFDEAGNLYIVQEDVYNPYICRFKLNDNGSYDSVPERTSSQVASVGQSPVAIAVDISGAVKKSADKPVNALYCSYDNGNQSYIKRLTWAKNAAFSSAADDASFAVGGTLEGPQDTTTGSVKAEIRFTALAADKNGFYVGETFKEKETNTKKHIIRVKKYAHNTTGYGTPESTIGVVPETVYYSATPSGTVFSLSENMNALFIQDGILYGVTAKEFKNEYDSDNHSQKASISGKLWKIGKTDAAFTTDTLKCLHSSAPNHLPGSDDERKEGGKFAPYRFIAVKPKKLVIASDGFYGYVENSTPPSRKIKQYNFIWTFELKADGSTGDSESDDKENDISFSKELKNQSGFPWE